MTTALEGGWVVSSTSWPHFTPGKDTVPIVQEARWTPGPVWMGGKSCPHRDSIPDRPAHSQSLHQLSYPAHKYKKILFCKYWIYTNRLWSLKMMQCSMYRMVVHIEVVCVWVTWHSWHWHFYCAAWPLFGWWIVRVWPIPWCHSEWRVMRQFCVHTNTADVCAHMHVITFQMHCVCQTLSVCRVYGTELH